MSSIGHRVRRVADAVLYEGYLLYPYRSTAAKNRIRWQFGVLGPPGAASAGLGEAADLAVACLLRPLDAAARVTVHLRFLHLQHRQVERADGPDRFTAVPELRAGATAWTTWDEAVEVDRELGSFSPAELGRGVHLVVRVDGGEERSASVHTLIAGNCGALPGNVLLLPDAEIDDGLFDIVTFRPEGFFGWAQIWAKITWENGILRRSSVGRKLRSNDRQVRALRYLKAKVFDIRLQRPEEFELDGDPFGGVIGFRLRVDPASLIVRVPA